MDASPQLSIIIVNHHSEAYLPMCLHAVADGDFRGSTEIIIVDNPDTLYEITDELSPDLHIKRIATVDRLGFGAACNRGAAEAAGEYLLFLNPDVVVGPSAITALYSALADKGPEALMTGRLTGRDGNFQATCRRFPTLKGLVFSRGSLLSRILKREGAYTLPDYDEVTRVDAAAAAMLMIPRRLFERLSGFDESFFMYMEDTDLCYRAFKAGATTWYVAAAGGRHHWGHATGRYRFRRILWHHRSTWRYAVTRRFSFLSLMALGGMLTVNCLLSLVFELCKLRQ